jgi:hypothetical protein
MRIFIAALVAGASIFLGAHLQPCPSEDSTGCTWYAQFQGDGEGDTSLRWVWED